MKNIIVTTSVKTNLELNEEAQQLADDLRLKYIIRNKKTIKQLLSSVDGVLVVYKNKLSYFEDDSELFFHLDTTALKIKNSDNEPLVEIIKEKEGNIFDLTIRITSDDTTWCKEELAPKLKTLFNFTNEIVVEDQEIQDNFLQLYATDKYFITPNSTYGYWVGYVLRVSTRNVQTFAPNFNTTLIENGRQIADTRDWILVDVDRSRYEGKE